jgi:hypothetical protein
MPQVDLEGWLNNIGTLEAACKFAQVIDMTWIFLQDLSENGDEHAREILEKGVSWLSVS